MNVEILRDYCLSKKGVSESFPFDETTLVLKLGNKIFALISLERELTINLKCEPEWAIELRENYSSILPGYHMNKTHWNTVLVDGSLSDKFIYEMIDHSYGLILNKLTKSEKQKII
jgi:predicted DNA-binding protein (MmcQ/YjbR family)